MTLLQQMPLEERYLTMGREALQAAIERRRAELGERLLILCHHYQQEPVYRFADLTGDSLKLSKQAARVERCEFLVFCGVHFMAEAADILTGGRQQVILPHLDAGCPMADMAQVEEVQYSWYQLHQLKELAGKRVIPVTYVNSSAAVKGFVGQHGGSVCTSSNADRVLRWGLEQGELVFFFPDRHLGENAARAAGLGDDEIVRWHRGRRNGGLDPGRLARARVLLWDGYCEVHQRIFPEHVRRWRLRAPAARIMVHPECRHEVVRLADLAGSTEAIIQAVADADAGSTWVIGTEINLVQRLAASHPDKDIQPLAQACLCPTMDTVDPSHLLWVLDNLAQGRVVNRIQVEPAIRVEARKALDRMLAT